MVPARYACKDHSETAENEHVFTEALLTSNRVLCAGPESNAIYTNKTGHSFWRGWT